MKKNYNNIQIIIFNWEKQTKVKLKTKKYETETITTKI